jgi:hypothetical protein
MQLVGIFSPVGTNNAGLRYKYRITFFVSKGLPPAHHRVSEHDANLTVHLIFLIKKHVYNILL